MAKDRLRKQKSLDRLRDAALPYLESLPEIEQVSHWHRRSALEVAKRALALAVVAMKGLAAHESAIQATVREYQLAENFSPLERAFIADPDVSEGQRDQFSWRIEGYWVLLWALKHVDALDVPSAECDAQAALAILQKQGVERFVAESSLREQSTILDEVDIVYRYHWAVRDARRTGKQVPAMLNPDVVQERHHALQWLVVPSHWDDVSTDT